MEDAPQLCVVKLLFLGQRIVADGIILIVGDELMSLLEIICCEIQLNRILRIDTVESTSFKSPGLMVNVIVKASVSVFCLRWSVGQLPVVVATGIERQFFRGL